MPPVSWDGAPVGAPEEGADADGDLAAAAEEVAVVAVLIEFMEVIFMV